VLALPDDALVEALGGRLAASLERDRREIPATAIRAGWERPGLWALCRHSERFPRSLDHLPDAPAVIHGAGRTERLGELLDAPAVAVVGARKASMPGMESARVLGRGLSAAGVTVVSGMALGIDAAAHEGALEAGANTIAVLACGADVAYPRSKRQMHERLRREGAVVSELPPGSSPFRWAFPARNRIIAALAEMTVVVEAAERSGSLITADLAISLGRDVAAVPGSPVDWRAAGTNQLLRDGASVARDAVDVLDDLAGAAPRDLAAVRGSAREERTPHPPPPPGLPEPLRELLSLIAHGDDTVDVLAATPQRVREVLADLTELELLGLVEKRAGGRYSCSRR
jgi:DNA processing protein